MKPLGSPLKNPLVKKAASFAQKYHKGQKRRTGAPYYIHPKEVAKTVAKWSHDAHAVAAAYLHDVIEDTKCDYEDIEERFGKRVAEYVSLMSRDFRKPQKESLALYRRQLAKAPSEVKLIAMADMEHNSRDIAEPSFMKKWYKKAETTLPYVTRGDLGKYKDAISKLEIAIKKKIAIFEDGGF